MTVTIPLRPPDWTADGLCLDVGAGGRDLWHMRGTEERARAVCAVCPVRLDCALLALRESIDGGVWGGLTVRDRKVVARRYGFEPPGVAAHGTRARYIHRTDPCRPSRTGIPCPSSLTCQEAHRRWTAGRYLGRGHRPQAVEAPPVVAMQLRQPVALDRAQVRRAKATGRRRR